MTDLEPMPKVSDVVTKPSLRSVADTVARFTERLNSKGIKRLALCAAGLQRFTRSGLLPT
jgi:hypothetical protein